MKRVGKRYLAIDPIQNSGSVVDIRRVWAARVPVTVVKVHPLRVRNRYDVRTDNGITFATGRLQSLKETRL